MGVGKALVIEAEFDKNFQLSARNLADVIAAADGRHQRL